MKSFLAGSDEYISGSTKSNLESVVVSACVILVIAVVETFAVVVVVEVVVEVVLDELDSDTDRSSAATAAVVVGMNVVVGLSSEQTVFSAAFHLQASSSNHEKKSLKYLHNIRYVTYRKLWISRFSVVKGFSATEKMKRNRLLWVVM